MSLTPCPKCQNILLNEISAFAEWVGSWIMMPLGFGFGFGLASLLGLPLRQKIAISLETGVQNIGLIIALIKLTFKEDQHDEALRFPMFVAFSYVFWIFGFVVMARYGLTKPPEKDIERDMEMIKIPPERREGERQEGETGTPMGEQFPMNEDSFDENLFNFKQNHLESYDGS